MKKHNSTTNAAKESVAIYENNIPMRFWAEDDLPSMKILLRGSYTLSDAELLSIIIGTGIPGENSLDIARNMLSRCGNNLNELWKSRYSELIRINGIGQRQAAKIISLFEISRRRNQSEAISRNKISNSLDAFQIFHSIMGDLPYEEFWILLLNHANRVVKKARISEGGMTGTVVDPKKLFQICLDNHATSIILGHNHPSGNLNPSEQDKYLTEKLKNAGKLLDISILDHVIVADDRFYSFADNGLL